MSNKLIFLTSFVLVLSLALPSTSKAGDPNLMGWWKFDGNTLDSSGNERHGTLHGNPQYVAGVYNDALEFDGDDYVNIDGYKGVLGTHPWSVAAWFRITDTATRNIISWGSSSAGQRIELRTNGNVLRANHGNGNVNTKSVVTDGQWHHVVLTVQEKATCSYPDMIFYLDGRDDTEPGTDPDPLDIVASADVGIGWRATHSDRYWLGAIDEVVMYDKVLTLEEAVRIMNGDILPATALASKPKPANEQTDVPREVVLSWTPGEFAPQVGGHKIYLSENFSDVNDGVGGITQDTNSYTPLQRLDFGTTYYWRVDEVNGPPDYTVYKGEVWSFTTEPIGYPIAGENIIATASSTHRTETGPEKTINGSGLDANDLHSKEPLDMWLSSNEPSGAWIQYELDKVYKLHQMWVWNSNQMVEPLIGLGFKDVAIEYSTNGTDWTTLGGVTQFAQAPGAAGYQHNTTVDFGGAVAKYVRLIAHSNWGFLTQYGLSEVRFFYIPIRAREPSPDSGATNVNVDLVLSFRAGREAARHDVYLSTDQQTVIDGTAPVNTITEASYGPLSLDLGKTYYWKINEVNMAETPTTLDGDVWSFTTCHFLVVDDFESYNDLDTTDPASNRIFNTWIDGYGTTTNGSIVGYENPPFCEKTIVNSDKQSMPFIYSNTAGKAYSEAERTFAVGQNWTEYGVKTLSLFFCGASGNTGQLYVKINGYKVTYDGDASNLALIGWQAWNIDLASVSVNLQKITKLAVGIDGNGASGKLYFDDIRLYPYSRVLLTPVEPDPAGLVLRCEFEGNFNDSSGKGRKGTGVGNPTFVAGKVGQAISLDGLDDFVQITGYKGILGPNAVTVTAWINTTSTVTGTIAGWGPNVDGQRFDFRINENRLRIEHGGGNLQGNSNVNDGQWHHIAVTLQNNATISYPDVILYFDGIDDTRPSTDPDVFNLAADQDVRIGSRPSSNDRFFMGLIDDVRIYDRALTQEEITWLAGRTKPFDKPF